MFVERARSYACNSGLSVAELVQASTIEQDRLLNIFEGKAPDITLREIAGISLALGVSLEILLA
tara:strand:+ start:989 stop:1180 length:192 start_codon:yes stop_codon:yes gene_type:complete